MRVKNTLVSGTGQKEYVAVEYLPISEIMDNIRELELEIGDKKDEWENLLSL